MAQSGFAAFLLFLGLVVSNVYGDDATIALCGKILNTTLNNGNFSDFNLTVTPAKLSSNTDYTVKLVGAGNFTVLLKALTLSVPVGNWSQQNNSCDGSPLFIESFLSSGQINTTWTSPVNVTNVTINAYIHNDTFTILLQQTLIQESNPATSNTTEAPTPANTTKPANTNVSTSTQHVQQTTSTGSMKQSSPVFMAVSVILSLLLIPIKYLS